MGKDVLQYIIVIIAAMVWIVSRMSKTAKTNTSTTPPVSPKQGKDLDEWWKELSKEIEAQTSPSAPSMVIQEVENKPIDNVNSDYFENLHKNYKNAEFILKHKPLHQLEIINDFDNTKDSIYKPLNINFKHNDEARRAFVYSEIFNRKY